MIKLNTMVSSNVYFDSDVSHCNTSLDITVDDWNVYLTEDDSVKVVLEGVSKSSAMKFYYVNNERYEEGDTDGYFYVYRNK